MLCLCLLECENVKTLRVFQLILAFEEFDDTFELDWFIQIFI